MKALHYDSTVISNMVFDTIIIISFPIKKHGRNTLIHNLQSVTID